MMCCDKALHILGETEYPRPTYLPRPQYNEWLQILSGAKFK